MPYIVTFLSFPSVKSSKVAEAYLEAIKKYPQDDTVTSLVVPGCVRTTIEGTKAMMISEVKEGKLDDAWTHARNIGAGFIGIKRVEYSLDLYSTIAEGFTSIEMSLPE